MLSTQIRVVRQMDPQIGRFMRLDPLSIGGNQETRVGYNADGQSEDISGLINRLKGAYSSSDFMKRIVPKQWKSKELEGVKKYVKAYKKMQKLKEDLLGSDGQSEAITPVIHYLVWEMPTPMKYGPSIDPEWNFSNRAFAHKDGSYSYPWGIKNDSIRNNKQIKSKDGNNGDTIRSTVYPRARSFVNQSRLR